jgi:hypothetical protein
MDCHPKIWHPGMLVISNYRNLVVNAETSFSAIPHIKEEN